MNCVVLNGITYFWHSRIHGTVRWLVGDGIRCKSRIIHCMELIPFCSTNRILWPRQHCRSNRSSSRNWIHLQCYNILACKWTLPVGMDVAAIRRVHFAFVWNPCRHSCNRFVCRLKHTIQQQCLRTEHLWSSSSLLIEWLNLVCNGAPYLYSNIKRHNWLLHNQHLQFWHIIFFFIGLYVFVAILICGKDNNNFIF